MIRSAAAAADVIIVGAGPAGAATALLLARAGVDVLLLDRHRFPRSKACGDCLSAGANAVLDRLRLTDAVATLPHARLMGWRIIAPDGNSFAAHFSLEQHALAVERRLFDDVILRAALAAGARFARVHVADVIRDPHGAVTGVATRTAQLRATLTVGADGLRSVVAARLGATRARGRLRKLSLTAHVEQCIIDDSVGEMHVGDGVCVGIAPVTGDGSRCNITVVADSDRFGRSAAADAHAFLLFALESLPRVRTRIADARLHDVGLLASGPFDRPVTPVVHDGAALVGDAAGYYDPFTGQGVFQALASAELLAHCALYALQRAPVRARDLMYYAERRAALVRGARLVQRGVEHVLARPELANRAIARIARAPAFAQAILGVTGDLVPAASLLSPRALGSLLIPPRTTECS